MEWNKASNGLIQIGNWDVIITPINGVSYTPWKFNSEFTWKVTKGPNRKGSSSSPIIVSGSKLLNFGSYFTLLTTTPPKINESNLKSGWFGSDDFPFQLGKFELPCESSGVFRFPFPHTNCTPIHFHPATPKNSLTSSRSFWRLAFRASTTLSSCSNWWIFSSLAWF